MHNDHSHDIYNLNNKSIKLISDNEIVRKEK